MGFKKSRTGALRLIFRLPRGGADRRDGSAGSVGALGKLRTKTRSIAAADFIDWSNRPGEA
jgi:hypothetical protein